MTEQQGGAEPIRLSINPAFAPTFDDMVTLESMGEKRADGSASFSWREIRDLFNRAIEGGVGNLPVDAATMQAIGAALKAHFEARANPNG